MSEEQKLNIAKANLPIKTKVAVWWLILMGITLTFLAAAYIFALFLQSLWSSTDNNGLLYVIMLFGGIFTFVSGILLLMKNKHAWKVAVSVFATAMICSIGSYLYLSIDTNNLSKILIILPFGLFIYLVPFILLIVDRKNYFRMAYTRELSQ